MGVRIGYANGICEWELFVHWGLDVPLYPLFIALRISPFIINNWNICQFQLRIPYLPKAHKCHRLNES